MVFTAPLASLIFKATDIFEDPRSLPVPLPDHPSFSFVRRYYFAFVVSAQKKQAILWPAQ